MLRAKRGGLAATTQRLHAVAFNHEHAGNVLEGGRYLHFEIEVDGAGIDLAKMGRGYAIET